MKLNFFRTGSTAHQIVYWYIIYEKVWYLLRLAQPWYTESNILSILSTYRYISNGWVKLIDDYRAFHLTLSWCITGISIKCQCYPCATNDVASYYHPITYRYCIYVGKYLIYINKMFKFFMEIIKWNCLFWKDLLTIDIYWPDCIITLTFITDDIIRVCTLRCTLYKCIHTSVFVLYNKIYNMPSKEYYWNLCLTKCKNNCNLRESSIEFKLMGTQFYVICNKLSLHLLPPCLKYCIYSVDIIIMLYYIQKQIFKIYFIFTDWEYNHI